jgi:putative isomerase
MTRNQEKLVPEKWWTWNSDSPAEIRHLGSGFIVTPVLYSAKLNALTASTPTKGVTLGRRPVGDTAINLSIEHADTLLEWTYDISTPDAVDIAWRMKRLGEWGLRFWILLVVRHETGASLSYDETTSCVTGRTGSSRLVASPNPKPVMVTGHASMKALQSEMEAHGYFYLASRGVAGACLALRFNLEEPRSMGCRFTTIGRGGSVASSQSISPARGSESTAPLDTHDGDARVDAIHDVLSWLHVYDFVHRRPYTGLSRFWNSQKFGGFGVWLNDVLYNAMLWGMFDPAKSLDNLRAVFSFQTPAGNFPCLVTGNDAWLDRTQPPVSAFVIWTLYLRTNDRSLLELAYSHLLRNYDWWFARRLLPGLELVGFGTSLDVGAGLYKGTKFAAKNESQMDNSPIHDPAPYDEATGMLLSADVGVNCMLAIEGEILSKMADLLGAPEAGRLHESVNRHKAAIAEHFWDDRRGIFANRLMDGTFVSPIAPTSFYPMAAGVSSPVQDARMIEGHLTHPLKFGGALVLPSVTRDDPAYGDNVYWRGRIWPPLNFWVYHGLRRAGHEGLARDLADRSFRLFMQSWADRICGENFNAETGVALDQPDTDRFFSFGALLPAIALAEVVDFTPWHGWSLEGAGRTVRVGPVRTPLGVSTIVCEPGSWRLETQDHGVIFETNVKGRISFLAFDGGGVSFWLPAQSEPVWIAFPNNPACGRGYERGRCGLAELTLEDGRFALPSLPAGAHVSFSRGAL